MTDIKYLNMLNRAKKFFQLIFFAVFLSACSLLAGRPADSEKVLYIDDEQALYDVAEKGTDVDIIRLSNRVYDLEYPLVFKSLNHVVLDGNGAVLLQHALDSNVMEIVDSTDLVISNIKALHIDPQGPEGCLGNVIAIFGGQDITIRDSELNGSGIVGIAAYNSPNLTIVHNYIHRNSHYAIIYMGPSVRIVNNILENNGHKNNIAYSYTQQAGWPPEEFFHSNIVKTGLFMKGNLFKD